MKRFIIPFIYIVTLFAMSCEHKDLCVHHPHTSRLRVVFDWKNCPEANPDGMGIWLYPVDNPNAYIYRDLSRTGGYIEVPDGEYNIICYNNDSETLMLSGTRNFDTHVGFTRTGGALEGASLGPMANTPVRATGAEDERIVICVDEIWGCNATNVSVYNGEVGYSCYPEEGAAEPTQMYNEERTITLYPTDLVCHYSYEIKHVTWAKYMTNACGTLSGMAAHYYFADGSLGDEAVTLPFATSYEQIEGYPNDMRLFGEFLTFGHHESNEKPHKLMIYVWRPGMGGNCYAEFDVTDQVDNAPDKRRVHIVIDFLKLTEIIDPTTGGGFDVFVPGFIEEEPIIIPMG